MNLSIGAAKHVLSMNDVHLVLVSVLAVAHKDLAGSDGVALDPAGGAALHRLLVHDPECIFEPKDRSAQCIRDRPSPRLSAIHPPSTPVPCRHPIGS